MKRTKEWWARLNEYERGWLVYYERNQHKSSRSPYLPDDCCECGVCGQPVFGYGTCRYCDDEYERILEKAKNG